MTAIATDAEIGSVPGAARAAGHGGLLLPALFSVTAFVGAGLVFLVQPLVARMLLPLLGGTPAVWNTSMLFFQAVLLLGYGYAHLLTRWARPRVQVAVHAVVLLVPLAVLPFALPGGAVPPGAASPVPWLLGTLAVVAGLPYVVVTTASPLLQRWFAGTDHPAAVDPYFLYAAGNAGSLLGLLAYPFVVEPRLALAAQSWLWTGGYGLFVLLTGASIALARRRACAPTTPAAPAAPAAPAGSERIGWTRRLRWLGWSFVPSSLVLGVTQFLSTDVAAVPLLWVVPLALYLASFVLTFARRRVLGARAASVVLSAGVLLLALHFLGLAELPLGALAALHLTVLFTAALVGHGRLAEDRPPPERLTGFFLVTSLGGVLGGAANALLAPLVFDRILEYPIVLAAALLLRRGALRPAVARASGWRRALAVPALAAGVAVTAVSGLPRLIESGTPLVVGLGGGAFAVAAVLLARERAAFAAAVAAVMAFAFLDPGAALHRERTFFGVHEVYVFDERHVLANGTTVHGYQCLQAECAGTPLSYFHPSGPIGQVFGGVGEDAERVAVVGLGTGALAAYGLPGAAWTFHEIDPAVVDIARDTRWFSYLDNSRAKVDVVLGDGRFTLAALREPVDLLVLDAFSSDAIPVHLLTREAIAGYADRLDDGGLVALHITNRHLALEPVIAAAAADLGLAGIAQQDFGREDPVAGIEGSHWVVLARADADLDSVRATGTWTPLRDDGRRAWTDDFSDLVGALSWD